MTSQTETGLYKKSKDRGESKTDQIDAINQAFVLFRMNFHNQYYSAFPDADTLNHTKKMWLDSLKDFSPEMILKGAKKVLESSEYLPTLHKMLECCRGDNRDYGLPDTRQAFLEACHAPSPKSNSQWSHPAVYFAGKDCDWFFLSSNTEQQTFPVFKESYQRWCDRVKAGEQLPAITLKQIENTSAAPLDKSATKEQLQALRKQLKI